MYCSTSPKILLLHDISLNTKKIIQPKNKKIGEQNYFFCINYLKIWKWVLKCFPQIYQGIFSSVVQSCPTLWDPMDCSTSGFPIQYQFPELAQTHVYQVGDATQPSHPLLSHSPPAFNLAQHQDLFQFLFYLFSIAVSQITTILVAKSKWFILQFLDFRDLGLS